MTAEPPRPTSWLRLRRRLFRSLPVLFWGACAVGVAWLWGREHPGLAGTGFAVETGYSVGSTVPGRLVSLTVALHDTVRRGQVVAGLDGEHLELRLKSARAELERLRAELARDEMLQGLSRDDERSRRVADLRRFARDVEETHVDYLRQLARIEEARVRRHGAFLELRRQEDLEGQGLASESLIDELRTEHEALGERIRRGEPVLAELDRRHRQAKRRFEEFRGALPGDLDADVLLRPHRWAIEAQRLALEDASLQRARLSLVAPADGRVEEILIRPGEVVAAGQTVLSIVDPRPREIVAWFEEGRHLDVAPGMVATLQRAAGRARVTTRVLRKGGAIRQLPARVTGDANLLRWGVPVYLACPEELRAVPGEAFTVWLRPGGGGP